MISRDTLLIRHLPPDLSLEEKEDLLKHFGATHVKCISSKVKKNNITFARFDGEDSAKQALGRLHQLDVLGFPLVVQFARGRSGQDFNLEKKHTIKNEKDAKENNRKNYESFLHKLNTWNAAVNFCEPPPAHLKYQYYPPTQAILVNISRTLAAVPKFYTQVLHLMNKMNLPSPFEPCFFPETYLPGGFKEHSKIVDVGETNQHNQSTEEESEIESDEGPKGPKDIIPEKRSLPQKKKHVKRPKLIQLTQILPTATSKSVMNPEEVFEKPQVETVQRKIELKLPPEAISAGIVKEDMSDSHGGFGLMFPTHQGAAEDQTVCLEEDRDIASDSSSVITLDQLAANRISTRDQRHLPVFKNYQPGVPSCRLYIKNLSKQVVERDLHFIYRRYLIPDFEEQGTMFDIRLMKEGRMKGQAFITLQTVKQAEQALEETNGFILKDKPMVVQFARSAKVK